MSLETAQYAKRFEFCLVVLLVNTPQQQHHGGKNWQKIWWMPVYRFRGKASLSFILFSSFNVMQSSPSVFYNVMDCLHYLFNLGLKCVVMETSTILTLLLNLVIKCMKIVFEHEKSIGGQIFCKNAKDNSINKLRRNCFSQIRWREVRRVVIQPRRGNQKCSQSRCSDYLLDHCASFQRNGVPLPFALECGLGGCDISYMFVSLYIDIG